MPFLKTDADADIDPTITQFLNYGKNIDVVENTLVYFNCNFMYMTYLDAWNYKNAEIKLFIAKCNIGEITITPKILHFLYYVNSKLHMETTHFIITNLILKNMTLDVKLQTLDILNNTLCDELYPYDDLEPPFTSKIITKNNCCTLL